MTPLRPIFHAPGLLVEALQRDGEPQVSGLPGMSAEQQENDCVWNSVGKDFRCQKRMMIKLS